jgi:hypothetical protein
MSTLVNVKGVFQALCLEFCKVFNFEKNHKNSTKYFPKIILLYLLYFEVSTKKGCQNVEGIIPISSSH